MKTGNLIERREPDWYCQPGKAATLAQDLPALPGIPPTQSACRKKIGHIDKSTAENPSQHTWLLSSWEIEDTGGAWLG